MMKKKTVHPTEIRTSISPSSAVKYLNTTSALANYPTEAGLRLNNRNSRPTLVVTWSNILPTDCPRAETSKKPTLNLTGVSLRSFCQLQSFNTELR
uniref:(California timema) hypothetical protein n=1 Tax=Timema californicum TaxID=61474 RepID=A0A7R9PE28_TIMCA|nr:unnamed protein product [Timema californicum]